MNLKRSRIRQREIGKSLMICQKGILTDLQESVKEGSIPQKVFSYKKSDFARNRGEKRVIDDNKKFYVLIFNINGA